MISPRGSKKIYVDWLGTEILLILNKTQLKHFVDDNKIESEDFNIDSWDSFDGYAGFAVRDSIPYYYMILNKYRGGTVAHESVHLSEYILRNKGIKPKGETLAYMVAHIYEQTIKHLINKEKK